MSPSVLQFCGLLWLLYAGGSVTAQPTPPHLVATNPDNTEPETDSSVVRSAQLPQVLVIEEKDRLLSKVPGAAAYIDAKEMRRVAALSNNEPLRLVPGVHVIDEEGLGLRTNISIRGLDGDRSRNVQVLEDGVPVQLGPYGEPEMYYSPTMDRVVGIEMVKGGGQILYGPRTIGGVINLITADAPLQGREGRISLTGGQGGFIRAALSYGQAVGQRSGFRVDLLRKQANQIGITGFEITDLTAKYRWILSDKSSLAVKVQVYDESSNGTYIGLTQGMFDGGDYFVHMAPDDRMKVRRYALSATHKHFFSPHLSLTTLGYAYTTTRNWRRQNFSSSAPSSGIFDVVWGDVSIPGGAVYMLPQSLFRNRSYEVGGLESRLEGEYNLGTSVNNRWIVGGRVVLEGARELEILTARPEAESGALQRDDLLPGRGVSGFVQHTSTLWKRFSLHVGLRYEYYHFERQVNLLRNSAGVVRDTFFATPRWVAAWIPGISADYRLSETTVLFAGIHRGFAPPAIKSTISQIGQVFDLDAQYSISYELGVRSTPTKGLYVELTGFLMDFSRQVIPVSESSGTAGTGFVNAGSTLHRGVEAALQFDFGKLLDSRHSYYLHNAFTFNEARFNSDRFITSGSEVVNINGNTLPYAPRILNTTSIGWAAPFGLDFRVQGTYVGSQFADNLNTIAPSANGRIGKIPAFMVIDLSAAYTYTPWNTTVQVAVKNLTDERYIVSRRPTGIRVGIPRWISIGAEVRF